jgi:hypothetical protein
VSVPATNMPEFSASLKAFAGLTGRQAIAAQKKVTLQILRGVILGNPVDTGRMRAAWIASVGAPATGGDRGEKGHAATGAIGEAAGTLAGLQLGQSTWVVNNVAYSGFVELHHPTKAGFVQAVVANVEASLSAGGA